MPGEAQVARGAGRPVCALLAVVLFVGCSDPPPSLGGREGPHRIEMRRNVTVEAPDRTRLRGDLYLPAELSGPLPSILIRLPYNREWYEPARLPARFFASWGYAVLVQDVRGRWGSEGRYRVLADDRSDGAATLTWMASQPWSNGRVGTFGCSNLGENQLVLAPARNPAHVAMIPQGAGGGVGTLGGWNTQFGAFDGGALGLAVVAGWFLDWGGEGRPQVNAEVDRRALFRTLPVAEMMRRAGAEDTDWRRFATEPPGSAFWDSVGYLADGDRFATPGLHLNTWYDPTVAQTLHLVDLIRERAVPGSPGAEQYAVIGPWAHCQLERAPDHGRLGELDVEGAAFPYWERYREWFDHWVRGEPADSVGRHPRFTFFVLGENRWRTSDAWPPEGWTPEEWFLRPPTADEPPGSAGALGPAPPADSAALAFRYDPMNPVPARGGNVCCTGLDDDPAGPVDRRYLDDRRDILRFVSAPLERDLTFAGPVDVFLEVGSTAPDTDFTAHLVDVRPDGTAVGLRDGILRMRYRDGGARANFMDSGTRYRIQIRLGDLAYRIPAGDRLRVDVSSSFFPRWDRNLNTQAPQGLGTDVRLADNTIFLGPETGARLVIYRAPADSTPTTR